MTSTGTASASPSQSPMTSTKIAMASLSQSPTTWTGTASASPSQSRYSKHKSIAHVFGDWNCNISPSQSFSTSTRTTVASTSQSPKSNNLVTTCLPTWSRTCVIDTFQLLQNRRLTGTRDNATTPTMPRRVEMLVEMQLVKLGFLRSLNSPNHRHLMIVYLRQTLADKRLT